MMTKTTITNSTSPQRILMLHSIWFEQNVRTRKDNDETKSKRDQSETLKENNKVEQEDDESKPCDHEGFLQPEVQRDLAQKLQKFSMHSDVNQYNGRMLAMVMMITMVDGCL